jgi:hypothetical protein
MGSMQVYAAQVRRARKSAVGGIGLRQQEAPFRRSLRAYGHSGISQEKQ